EAADFPSPAGGVCVPAGGAGGAGVGAGGGPPPFSSGSGVFPREYGMRKPLGLIIGDRPWARRFLSDKIRASGGGSRRRLSKSGGMKSMVLSRFGFTSTFTPIISAPRRNRSGATTRRRISRMWRKMETSTIVRRRHRATSSSSCNSRLSWDSSLMGENRNSKLEAQNGTAPRREALTHHFMVSWGRGHLAHLACLLRAGRPRSQRWGEGPKSKIPNPHSSPLDPAGRPSGTFNWAACCSMRFITRSASAKAARPSTPPTSGGRRVRTESTNAWSSARSGSAWVDSDLWLCAEETPATPASSFRKPIFGVEPFASTLSAIASRLEKSIETYSLG